MGNDAEVSVNKIIFFNDELKTNSLLSKIRCTGILKLNPIAIQFTFHNDFAFLSEQFYENMRISLFKI